MPDVEQAFVAMRSLRRAACTVDDAVARMNVALKMRDWRAAGKCAEVATAAFEAQLDALAAMHRHAAG